jgi:hypothetical protein
LGAEQIPGRTAWITILLAILTVAVVALGYPTVRCLAQASYLPPMTSTPPPLMAGEPVERSGRDRRSTGMPRHTHPPGLFE